MKQIVIERNILKKNDEIAEKLKNTLKEKGVYTINLLGSPGAGKTTLLENIIVNLKDKINIAVIEGDLYTAKDGERIESHGVEVVQVNTGGGCHLDSSMVEKAIEEIDIDNLDLLVIENVGNLVCPASYDLSENIRVVVTSVTEGNDKVAKYPAMFKSSSSIVLNKIDLLSYTDFDLNEFYKDVRKVNKDAKVINVSCIDKVGINNLCTFILKEIKRNKNV